MFSHQQNSFPRSVFCRQGYRNRREPNNELTFRSQASAIAIKPVSANLLFHYATRKIVLLLIPSLLQRAGKKTEIDLPVYSVY